MADRTNHRLNCLIEKEIRMWDGTVHGATVRYMYENGSDYESIQKKHLVAIAMDGPLYVSHQIILDGAFIRNPGEMRCCTILIYRKH